MEDPPSIGHEPANTTSVGSGTIGIKPGFCDGLPHILGHRIKVSQVACWHEQIGMSPAQIVAVHPEISLIQVEMALAYYRAHREEIEADLNDGAEFVEKIRASQPSILEEARNRSCKDDAHSPG